MNSESRGIGIDTRRNGGRGLFRFIWIVSLVAIFMLLGLPFPLPLPVAAVGMGIGAVLISGGASIE
jgi:hypothetical protein